MGNVFRLENAGEIHCHIYILESYDGREPHVLVVTLPHAASRRHKFTDGAVVSSLLGKEPFDLVLLDLMLPGKGGYEVYREIRDQADIPNFLIRQSWWQESMQI